MGSVAVGEGGSLLQAAHSMRPLIVGHALKISKRLATEMAVQKAELLLGLAGPFSILAVPRTEVPADLDAGFGPEVAEFLQYEAANATAGAGPAS